MPAKASQSTFWPGAIRTREEVRSELVLIRWYKAKIPIGAGLGGKVQG